MIRSLSYQFHDLLPYVNWIYFFHSWGIFPRFAAIADVHNCRACRQSWIKKWEGIDRTQAIEAEKLYSEALSMLRQLDGQYHVHARFGLFPAWSEGDDIVVLLDTEEDGGDALTSENKSKMSVRLPFLRQQAVKGSDDILLCLSDFIAPKEVQETSPCVITFPATSATPRGRALGLFATAVEKQMEQRYASDSYRRMLVQTLADRMAEAAAEKLHAEIRRTYWGYAPNETFSMKELFKEKYEGRRPAIGYPSIPDQSINFLLDEILHLSEIGIQLTDSGMMSPHAAVSGFLFDHPSARHFSVGTIGNDQLHDYARRRGYTVQQCQKFLLANLKDN